MNGLSDAIKISKEYIEKKKVYEVFDQSIDYLIKEIKDIKPKKRIKKNDMSKLSVTIGLFDLHIGELIKLIDTNNKVNEVYNTELVSTLMDSMFEKIYQTIDLLGDKVGEINVALGGDIVEGDGSIYSTQIYDLSKSISDQLEIATVEIVKKIIALSSRYQNIPINVYAVVGNHGEMRGSMPKKLRDNYDNIISKYIKLALYTRKRDVGDLKNVSMVISEDSYSVYINTLNGHIIEVLHELPNNLLTPKTKQIILSRKIGWNVDAIITGHYHSPAFVEVGNVKVVRSGSLPGPNAYSHKLGIPPESRNQIMIVSSKDNVTEMIISIQP